MKTTVFSVIFILLFFVYSEADTTDQLSQIHYAGLDKGFFILIIAGLTLGSLKLYNSDDPEN